MNGSICHRRQSVQLPDPTVRARVDDGHRLIFVDSANIALRAFVARDIRRGELRVSTRNRYVVCACSVTQYSRIQVVILVEQHLLDDSHAHLSVARFATREEQFPARGKQFPSTSTRTGLSDDVSSFVTVFASRAVEMVSSCRSIYDGEITCRGYGKDTGMAIKLHSSKGAASCQQVL